MGIADRLRRVEQKVDATPDTCPQCKGVIIFEKITADGTSSYPDREPCPACDSRGSGGRIGRIIVDMRDPEDRPEGHGSTPKLGEVYQVVEEEAEFKGG